SKPSRIPLTPRSSHQILTLGQLGVRTCSKRAKDPAPSQDGVRVSQSGLVRTGLSRQRVQRFRMEPYRHLVALSPHGPRAGVGFGDDHLLAGVQANGVLDGLAEIGGAGDGALQAWPVGEEEGF